MSRHDSEFDEHAGVNAGYAVFQLSRALTASQSDDGPQARDRIERWLRIVEHLMQGSAQYGSRVPFADLPEWVTLEVATGGFATGQLLAGGVLTAYERQLAESIPGIRAGHERFDLNVWHLSDAGLAALQERLTIGTYQIDVPEEAALLTVSWLLRHQRIDEARTLIEQIAPFFDRLRFFPTAIDEPPIATAEVHVFDTGSVRQRLSRQLAQPRLAVQKHVVENRLPLYDAAVSLFLLTYQDGWPCRHYPEGWFERATLLGTQIAKTCDAELHSKGPFKTRAAELFAMLAQCSRDQASLTGREVGRIRRIVDDFVAKHGHPESVAHSIKRAEQRNHVASPGHHLFALAVSDRLASYPDADGVREFSPLLESITDEEAKRYALTVGATIPPAVRRRLERCRKGTIAELIDHGLISSADTVAKVFPAMTAEICNTEYREQALQLLAGATYRAFRRRRSLLLLNLQKQVKITELPWVAVLEGEREASTISITGARQVLVEVSALTLSAFPQAIVPNKLLQEFVSLAETAKLDLPFVEEVAADIFMGAFSNKFARAAKQSASLIDGTLYARYYDIDIDALAGLPDQRRSRRRSNNRDALAMLCAQRANATLGTYQTAVNGTILEQQQILTTQNLALLFGELDLKTLLHHRLSTLALACFKWICKRHQMHIELYHGRLVMLKNTAYAWRQMVFYLSMLDGGLLRSTLEDLESHFAVQSSAFRERFQPAMVGLRVAAAGYRLTLSRQEHEGARVFLGWTTERHWLMPS
ncbi:hypothetical protein C2E19_17155 [Pseudomonas sp. DTU12.3]|uniref:hypothetical protein n=1 Tax=Pseudomonas sp. DTU12.3 TaxID=2073078 RepID=UPI0010125928|nr:hypothetical protein [Pseudomonas sp. DTU12.3]QAX85472.1 hypothetical protein C2E19_17155 [Pseudomonas sp. DTU12.3]